MNSKINQKKQTKMTEQELLNEFKKAYKEFNSDEEGNTKIHSNFRSIFNSISYLISWS